MSLVAFLLELKEKRIYVNNNQEKLAIKAEKNALNDDIRQRLSADKYDILALLDQLGISSNANIAPLTYGQRGLWYIDQLGEGSREYNQLHFIQLDGELNLPLIEQAYNRILQRHEVLRTTFFAEHGEPYQIIHDWQRHPVEIADLSSLNAQEQSYELKRLAETEALTVFDLSSDLMLRVKIFKLSDCKAVMVYCLHHIASDGWSLTLLENEFIELFNSLRNNREESLPELKVQYADYAHWQRQFFQDDVYQQHLDYWMKKLENLPPVHKLPLDFTRPEILQRNGGQYVAMLDPDTTAQLQQLCKQQNVTLFMVLYSLLSLLLSRYSNESDIVIGTSIANREQAGIQELIGYFVNSLVLRVDLTDCKDFNELLQRCSESILDAYQYNQMPFEELVNKLGIDRSASHDPVFQIMLVLQNNTKSEGQLQEVESSDSSVLDNNTDSQTALFDLNINVMETPAGLEVVWDYNKSLFKHETIIRMADNFIQLTCSALSTPNKPLLALPMLTNTQREQLLSFNPKFLPESGFCTSAQQFEAIVEQHSEQIAVEFGDTQITYKELNEHSNRLACFLKQSGIKEGDTVGLLLPRSIELIISIWALYKLGAAYLPVDIDYPSQRQLFMLRDSGAKGVICFVFPEELVDFNRLVFELGNLVSEKSLDEFPSNNLKSTQYNPDQTAYVVYTSGTTGQPKGIAVSQRNLVAYVDAVQVHYKMVPGDRMLQFSSISFDIFVDEMFPALLSGATLVLRNEQINQSSQLFWEFVCKYQISVVHLPTAFWHLLVIDLDKLQQLSDIPCRLMPVGGEKMSASMLQRWQQIMPSTIQLLNSYGPSETTVAASVFDVTKYHANSEDVPIGPPLNNYRIMILESEHELAPIGVDGELYIAGLGVADGYINRDDLNEKNFVDIPIGSDDGKWFRTGDIARFNDAGLIEFSGRRDKQIKFRSYRIEPGEIEFQLNQLETISFALVDVTAGQGDKQLVAYVQPQQEVDEPFQSQWVQDVKRDLRKLLPAYLIPTLFVLVEKMPMTINGKLDKEALPPLDKAVVGGDYKAPTTDTEQSLLQIWSELLQLPLHKVSITAHFFELGGNSLMVVKLLSAISHHFRVDITLPMFYDDPCVEGIAPLIDVELVKSTLHSKDVEEYTEEMEW